VIVDEFGEAEVSDLSRAIMQQNITGLEISVDNVVLVKTFKAFDYVTQDAQGFFFA